MKDPDNFIEQAVYGPDYTAAYTKQYIDNIAANKNRAIQIGVPSLRGYFAPLMPGQLCAVIAQTSHYKSGFLHSWERSLAQELMDQDRKEEIIVHVSVEESVEEQGILQLAVESGEDSENIARGEISDYKKITWAIGRIGIIPIYRIGNALSRPEDQPNLYLSNIIKAIEFLESRGERKYQSHWQPKIAAIFFDYLQAFPFDPEHRVPGNDQRRLQVREDIYRLRNAASQFNCPVVVAVQAKQHLDGAPSEAFYMPGIYDGEESSSIAQRSDRIITLWMPKMTHPIGSTIKYKEIEFTIDPNLIFVKIAKQRGRLPSGATYKCRIDFQNNRIAEEETHVQI